jgi:hypothetical protein
MRDLHARLFFEPHCAAGDILGMSIQKCIHPSKYENFLVFFLDAFENQILLFCSGESRGKAIETGGSIHLYTALERRDRTRPTKI